LDQCQSPTDPEHCFLVGHSLQRRDSVSTRSVNLRTLKKVPMLLKGPSGKKQYSKHMASAPFMVTYCYFNHFKNLTGEFETKSNKGPDPEVDS
jgi:hypothetical protein